MLKKSPEKKQTRFLYNGLAEMLNPQNSLYQLSNKIPWEIFEREFSRLYRKDFGRPGKAIRLMVSLLLLKQMHELSDETVLQQWVQNPYWQYFSGEKEFQWRLPVCSSDLTHFRKRIGDAGVEKIFQISIALHGKAALEDEVVIDTTVQEKNITYPVDSKFYRKIINQCRTIASQEGIILRQSYLRVVKRLLMQVRSGKHPRRVKQARQARRKLRTIAGRLIRELERKLPLDVLEDYRELLALFRRVLRQQRTDRNKIYSLHEQEVHCISKGKEHKKYEFGSKACITTTKNSGIIVGALDVRNRYDGHCLPDALKQCESLRGVRPKVALTDRGFKGVKHIDGTDILLPGRSTKQASVYEKSKARKRFRRRAGIEPRIGHLKSDCGLGRNYLKGVLGDSINLMLAAAAYNFKKLLREFFSVFSPWKRALCTAKSELTWHLTVFRALIDQPSCLNGTQLLWNL